MKAIAPIQGSGAMFDRIAARYDLLNRIISLGIDQRWRRRAARLALAGGGRRILDVATGTGDLALEMLRQRPDALLVGVDPSHGMLERARTKAERAGRCEQLVLRAGVAEDLRFADESFDAVTIAFGIRNTPCPQRALAEMLRVLRPKGRLVVLELGEPRRGWLAPLARFHVHRLVPVLGALLSGAREYRYLERSVAAFPSPTEFAGQMLAAGYTRLEVESLTCDCCHLYCGRRP
jgi:demethylmenaquinone methyltransferase/2-methoxy-6-polyprenyl-1,4-benzoquinol methylase